MSETLLIVDDSPTNIEVLYKTLEDTPYRILVARDGESALAIVASQKPTLVLLDIMMPGIDGFEVCRQIKANPDVAKTPVIFLSALGDTEAKVKGFQLGGVDYIAKPFQAEEVVVRVNTHMRIRQLEREMEAKNEALSSDLNRILSTMQEGVYGIDKTGVITFSNPAASDATGYSAEELHNVNVFEHHFGLCEEAKKKLSAPLEQLAKGEMLNFDCVTMTKKDQPPFFAELNICPNFVEGEFAGAVMVFRDITRRKAYESELAEARDELQSSRQRMAHVERLSTVGEMAAGFAHEVNQPLTAITNYASVAFRLVSQPELDFSRMQETLRKLQTQAIRASEVIQRLRDFVRTPKDNKVVKDANKIMSTVLELSEVDSRKLGVGLEMSGWQDVLPVYIDDVQIQQVALNLIRNAMEATAQAEQNALPVKVSVVKEQDAVQINVRDYGVGLAKDAEEHLFTPFYTTKATGMGIGLSVCDSIMQEHGGSIGFTRHQPGTEFTMRLPLYD